MKLLSTFFGTFPQQSLHLHRRYIISIDVPDVEVAIEADAVQDAADVKTEYRKLQKELEAFEAVPDEERNSLEAGHIQFSVLPRLAELERQL